MSATCHGDETQKKTTKKKHQTKRSREELNDKKERNKPRYVHMFVNLTPPPAACVLETSCQETLVVATQGKAVASCSSLDLSGPESFPRRKKNPKTIRKKENLKTRHRGLMERERERESAIERVARERSCWLALIFSAFAFFLRVFTTLVVLLTSRACLLPPPSSHLLRCGCCATGHTIVSALLCCLCPPHEVPAMGFANFSTANFHFIIFIFRKKQS